MLRPGECPETCASGGQLDAVSASSYRTPLRTLLDTSAAVQQTGVNRALEQNAWLSLWRYGGWSDVPYPVLRKCSAHNPLPYRLGSA
jgi:hypothetical protein